MELQKPARPWEYSWRIAILFLSQPALAAISSWATISPELLAPPQFTTPYAIAATILAAIGLFIRVWGTSFLSAAVVTGLSIRNDRLVTGGPFGIIRNPLYLGTLFIFAGYSLFFGPWLTLGFVVFHWIRYGRVIRYEEQMLRNEWGAEFDHYCRDVPRWLPKKSIKNNMTGPFLATDGILGNAVFLGMFLGFVVSSWAGTLIPMIYLESAGGAVALFWSNRERFQASVTAPKFDLKPKGRQTRPAQRETSKSLTRQ